MLQRLITRAVDLSLDALAQRHNRLLQLAQVHRADTPAGRIGDGGAFVRLCRRFLAFDLRYAVHWNDGSVNLAIHHAEFQQLLAGGRLQGDTPRQRQQHQVLDGALERARAVSCAKPLLEQRIEDFFTEVQQDVAAQHALTHQRLTQFAARDTPHLVQAEWLKNDDLIKPVDEFRAEILLDGLAHLLGADRKSTRLNSSHVEISYAVFC